MIRAGGVKAMSLGLDQMQPSDMWSRVVVGFRKIKLVNILVDNSTAIAFAKCATKHSELCHIDCSQ